MKKTLTLLAALAATAAIAPTSASASTTDATTAQPCIYVIEDADCIDPAVVVRRVGCAIADRIGAHCIDAASSTSTRDSACILIWLGAPHCLGTKTPCYALAAAGIDPAQYLAHCRR